MLRYNTAMSVSLKWNGDRFKKQMKASTIVSLTRGINLVDRDIKLGTPVRSGTLKGGNEKTVDAQKLIAVERNKVEYAPNVEFGTRYQSSQPFFRTGFVKNIRNIIAIFKAEGKKAVGS